MADETEAIALEMIAAQLRAAYAGILETEPLTDASETATSPDQRGIAKLLAEAGQDHLAGDLHLLWRSKSFTRGGISIDP